MPADVMEIWLRSGKAAQIGTHSLRPKENPRLPGLPLSIHRGQAESFFGVDAQNQIWILKKFHAGRQPDATYLNALKTVLPPGDGFRCGTAREILSAHSLTKTGSMYYSNNLAHWLGDVVLMPKVPGDSWSSVAEDLRQGSLAMLPVTRMALARALAEMILALEAYQCAHRDIGGPNLLIEAATGKIFLIDFDSLYHPRLTMPKETTSGTNGYMPGFVFQANQPCPARSWQPGADRFALGLLIVEFLLIRPGSPATEEGGLFDQQELGARAGRGLARIQQELKNQHPALAPMFDRLVQSRSFSDCPTPQEWLNVCPAPCTGVGVPTPDPIGPAISEELLRLFKRLKIAPPCWPVPQLSDLPPVDMALPSPRSSRPIPVVSLPEDPWKT